MMTELNFAVAGIDHGHINGQVADMRAAGARLAGWWADAETPAPVVAAFAARHPDAPRRRLAQILDSGAALLLIAAIPDRRAALAIAAMRAGMDVMVDKPGCLTLAELALLRQVQAETGRIWSVCFSERHRVPACTLADDLVAAGRIGDVVQVAGFGPHALKPATRPGWFFDPARAGGLLTDLASHQAHQFLHYTGSRRARVTLAHVECRTPGLPPGFADYGEVAFAGDRGRGMARVDWLSPAGVPVYGDSRLLILGTAGTIELRKTIDPAGAEGDNHVILADRRGIERIDAGAAGTPYFARLAADIRARSETAMPQAECFLACQLTLEAQAMASAVPPAG